MSLYRQRYPSLVPRSPARLARRSIALSAVEGPSQPPLVSHTLPEYFTSEILGKHGSRPALVARSEKPRPYGGPLSPNMGISRHLAWDFGEFNATIQALARGLLNLGVKKGDRVGVVMGNSRCGCWQSVKVARVCAQAIVQCVRIVAMGMCEHRCHPRYS